MAYSNADDHTNPTRQRTVLLATDNKNSVFAEVVAGKANHVAYSVYGQQSAQQEVMTQLGFNGELREARIGWYLLGNGYRAYNPRLMRFHSPDSWSPFGRGGLNPYMYCVGDPVNWSDPTGHGYIKTLKNFFKTLGPGKSRPVKLSEQQLRGALEMIGQAHNARINYVAPPTRSSGIGDILYTLGTAHPMRRDSPRITSVATEVQNHPGYVQGAAMSGLTNRPSRSTPRPPKPRGASGGLYERPRENSFDAPRTLYDGPTPREPVLVNEKLLGGTPHSGPPQPPPPAPSSSSSSSSSTSRDSTPPRSRNNSSGNNAPNFDDLKTGLRFIRR